MSSRPTETDGDTEQRILDAARRVFVRRGTVGARMQEIAAEAGVNQALLHYYFRSKDRLAAVVFKEVAARLLPAIAGLLGSDASIEEKVEGFVHLYIDGVRQSPFIPGYLVSELHQQPERLTALIDASGTAGRLAADAVRQRLAAQLRDAAAAGTIRPITAEQFFVSMVALCVMPFLARPLLDALLGMDSETFDRFLDERRSELPGFIIRGLRP
ncbi:MAG TPA: TetR/AcrR family transcriptional regulator [Gemmatimonadaceae bacterium]